MAGAEGVLAMLETSEQLDLRIRELVPTRLHHWRVPLPVYGG
jgi:hypothetical protein